MFPDGLIAQDGRLRPGDQIIEINGVDMTCANHLQVRKMSPFFSPNCHLNSRSCFASHAARVFHFVCVAMLLASSKKD